MVQKKKNTIANKAKTQNQGAFKKAEEKKEEVKADEVKEEIPDEKNEEEEAPGEGLANEAIVEEQTFNKDDVQRMIAETISGLKDQITKEVKEEFTSKITKETGLDLKASKNIGKQIADAISLSRGDKAPMETEIDPDDIMEDPVTFFNYSLAYAIHSDKRSGREIIPPRNEPVRFTPLIRHQKPLKANQKEPDIINICVATIYSKATIKWLKEHTLYGVEFFEDYESAGTLDTRIVDERVSAMRIVGSWAPPKIVNHARNLNELGHDIKISNNIENIKRQVVEAMATEAIKSKKQKQKKVVELTEKAAKDLKNEGIEIKS